MSDIRKETYPYSDAHKAAYAALRRGNEYREIAQNLARVRDRLEVGGYSAGNQIIDAEIYAQEQSSLGYVQYLTACKD